MPDHTMTAAQLVQKLRQAQGDELAALIERHADDGRKQVRSALDVARRRLDAQRREMRRVQAMYELEDELAQGGVAIGVDEVGRGSVAGPLTVCAVVLPRSPLIWGLNDSKQLRPAQREQIAAQVAQLAIAIGIAHVENTVIDERGMARALRLGMAQAIERTGVEPDVVLIDGNPVHVHPRERCLVKGDARVASIAAASIVAKVTRDALMVALARDYPGYDWESCKGYASAQHVAAIRAKGLTPLHRTSFCRGFVEQPKLFLS
jgi:ribonuclease HII